MLRGDVMRKEGEKLIVEPVPPKSLLDVLAKLAPLHEEFPKISDSRPRSVDV
jgi:antitoxin VapB